MNEYEVDAIKAQLWRYMQHQEEVQHERMARYKTDEMLVDNSTILPHRLPQICHKTDDTQ